jgi:hypothetical protein
VAIGSVHTGGEYDMGVTLLYTTTEPVPQAKSEIVIADVNAAIREARQPWLWCEPLQLVPTSDGRLQGWSKLNPIPHPDDRADAARYPNAENDLTFLLGQLCRLSREHHVTWELSLMGQTLGRIVDGDCEPGLADGIEALASLGEELGSLDPSELGLDDLM